MRASLRTFSPVEESGQFITAGKPSQTAGKRDGHGEVERGRETTGNRSCERRSTLTTPSLIASSPGSESTPTLSSTGDSFLLPDHAALWQDFWRLRSDDLRNQLVAKYLPLAKLHARRIAKRFSSRIQAEEIFSASCEGLMHAVTAFDPQRGIKFETFAARRIIGAVLDWLRSIDEQSRMLRLFERRRLAAWNQLSCQHGRPATESEVVERLGISPRRYGRMTARIRAAETVSIESDPRSGRGSASDEPARWELPPRGQPSPGADMERQMLRDFLCRGLTRAERHVLVLYYYEDLNMVEVGRVLGLSEARICQMHRDILRKLSHRLSLPAARMAV